MSGEATSLFNLADYQKKVGLVAEARRCPPKPAVQRWCFVAELFHRVILPDPMGQAVAFASRRTDIYRRIAFGAAALGLILGALWIRSWWNNAGPAGGHAEGRPGSLFVPAEPADAPSLEALRASSRCATRLETLLDYDRNGAPWRMRWGLYAGTDALPSVYDLYFQRFRQLFFDDMQSSISGTLLRLPGSPDAQNSYNGNLRPGEIVSHDHAGQVLGPIPHFFPRCWPTPGWQTAPSIPSGRFSRPSRFLSMPPN